MTDHKKRGKKPLKKVPVGRLIGNMSISLKLTLVIVIAAVVPMVLTTVTLSSRMYDMVSAQTLQQEQQASARTSPLLASVLQNVSDTSDRLQDFSYADTLFRTILGDPIDQVLTPYRAGQYSDYCQTLLKRTDCNAVRIYIDLPKEMPVFKEDNVFCPMSQITSTYWYGIFYSSHPASLYCPPFYLGEGEREDLGDCAFIRPLYIRDYTGKSIKAYMAVYFSSDLLSRIMKENLSSTESLSYIANSRDAIITSTDSALSGLYYMDYDSIRSNLFSTNGMMEREVVGQKVYLNCYYITPSEWVLVTVTPSGPLASQANRVLINIIVLWAVVVALGIFLAYILSRRISGRIINVSSQMSQVRSGLPRPMKPDSYHDEVGELVTSYNYMVHTIDDLISSQQRASEELRISEFKSLQAQINPHFLYNTMEMINWMAQQGRIKEIGMAIRDLSRFYRLTLSKKEAVSTIAEEIEHVTIYVRLQNMRFDNAVDFVVDVPDYLTDYSIPRLTLQPIVENAILHGILETENHSGTIVLTGWEENDHIVLLISDDGVGMDRETLDNILNKNAASAHGGNHIAIYNTHRRIQILYGKNYGLIFRSTKGKGTEVEIHLPAEAADEALQQIKTTGTVADSAGRTQAESVEQSGRSMDRSKSQGQNGGPGQVGGKGLPSPQDLRRASPYRRKMEKAADLLLDAGNNLYSIAEACGYSNMDAFKRDFVAYYGFTPEEYRRIQSIG